MDTITTAKNKVPALNHRIASCAIVPCGIFHAAVVAAVLLLAPAAQALTLPDGATLVRVEEAVLAPYRIALGPHAAATGAHVMAEGDVTRQTWQIPDFDGTTEELMGMLQMQLEGDGFTAEFRCADRDCGGFDFRFALDVGQAPAMYVDLGDYAYLSVNRTVTDGQEYIALMVSQGGGRGYVNLTRVAPPGFLPEPVAVSSRAPLNTQVNPDEFTAELLQTGRATLDDLEFETGASSLSGNTYPSLIVLAAYLARNTAAEVALVGHTDVEGSLDGNIALSRARAASVRQFLINELGVRADQVVADGVGYLAPRASNLDADGRQANRRVEVVLITDQ